MWYFEKYFGVHLTPADYYSPVPVLSELTLAELDRVSECPGIDWNEQGQMDMMTGVFPRYSAEFTPAKNRGLTLVDSLVLYAMIRERKPKVMVEIGAGDTTHISLRALDKNHEAGQETMFYCVEPYPREDLRAIRRSDFELIPRRVQDVGVELLASADILFIDSSHVSKIGSDVNYEICEVVPRLKIGSLIHWHDIPMPKQTWHDWVQHGNMFWNESYLLHAFLMFNGKYSIRWASQYMFLRQYERL